MTNTLAAIALPIGYQTYQGVKHDLAALKAKNDAQDEPISDLKPPPDTQAPPKTKLHAVSDDEPKPAA